VESRAENSVWNFRRPITRLGAAIYRNDEFIPVEIVGDIDYAVDLFGLKGAK